MMSSNPILDEPINEINVPVMQPTRNIRMPVTSKSGLGEKSAESVRDSINEFADWISSYVPEPIQRNVDERVEKLKEEIREFTQGMINLRFMKKKHL